MLAALSAPDIALVVLPVAIALVVIVLVAAAVGLTGLALAAAVVRSVIGRVGGVRVGGCGGVYDVVFCGASVYGCGGVVVGG